MLDGSIVLASASRIAAAASDRTHETGLELRKRCNFGNDPWTLWDGFQTLPRPSPPSLTRG